MDADFMMVYAAAFVAAFVMLGAHPVCALDIPSMAAIAEKIPIETVPYVGGAIALIILLLAGIIYYGIKYKHSRMDLPMPEKHAAAQQPLRDAEEASTYMYSKKKVFEDAETEYLLERLKEAKKEIEH